MKRTKTVIRILLVLILLITVYTRVNQSSIINEAPALSQKEAVEPAAPAEELQKSEGVARPASIQSVIPDEVKTLAPEKKIITESVLETEKIMSDLTESLEVEVVESDDFIEPEEQTGVQIVKISFSESEFESTIVIGPDHELSAAKGFRIYGNWDETPLNLVVKSSDSEGSTNIHYLDWNAKHPNEFKLTDNLGTEAEVSIYKDENQVAQFTLNSPIDEDYIALDLSEPVRLALAE